MDIPVPCQARGTGPVSGVHLQPEDRPESHNVIWPFWDGILSRSNVIKQMKNGADIDELQPISCAN